MGFSEATIRNPSAADHDFSHINVLGLGGTTRDRSSSERALECALQAAAEMGAQRHLIGGSALPSEIYDPNVTARSAQAQDLVAALRKADVLLLSTPCYHGSVSGYIKNALDYVEDMRGDARPYLDGVPVGIICSALGWQAGGATLATMRGIVHSLRGWPTPMGVIVNTTQTAFEADGRCSEAHVEAQIRTMMVQALDFARKARTSAYT